MSEALERGRALTQKLNPDLETILSERYDGLLPDFAESLIEWAYGRHYCRPGLDLKTRQLCTIAALGGQTSPQLKINIDNALAAGATRTEVVEAIWQMAVYGGMPAAINGLNAAREVFKKPIRHPSRFGGLPTAQGTNDEVNAHQRLSPRVRTHKIVPSGRSGKDRLSRCENLETSQVSCAFTSKIRSFPERSKGRQSDFEKRRQSLCAMQPHGSAGFSSIFCAGLTPEGTILWVRTLVLAADVNANSKRPASKESRRRSFARLKPFQI